MTVLEFRLEGLGEMAEIDPLADADERQILFAALDSFR